MVEKNEKKNEKSEIPTKGEWKYTKKHVFLAHFAS